MYIPGSFVACSPAVVILTSNGISAENFYKSTRGSDWVTVAAAFDLDERSLYWVCYGEGGSAVHKMALLWPQLFAGLVSINGEVFRLSIMELPVPIWNQYTVFPDDAPDDVSFIQTVIEITKQNYPIDDI